MKRHQLIALAAVVLVACVDGGRSNGPSFAISDAVHGGGTAGFYFLPPMVPSPTISEQFNAFLQPEVTICKWVDDACASTLVKFTRTSGAGSEIIRVSTVDKQYVVNWHTDEFNVLAGEQYRIQVFADPDGQFPLGFADVAIAATGKEAKNLTTMETIGLVDGRTLPIKFFAGLGALGQCDPSGPTCAEAIVPPAGGLVVAVNADGEAEAFADFPTDWTDEATTVMIERIDDRPFETPFTGPLGAPSGVRQWPLFYEFTTNREGLRFAKRVRIGVCNIEDPSTDPFHPEDRSHVSLAIGASANDFRTLPFAPVEDILGLCDGVTRMTTASLPGRRWQALFARAAALATSVVLPRPLYARAVAVVDGGAGGSTDSFESPVGTVDLAPAPDLFIPTGTPTVTPSTVAPGGTVQLSAWTIKNRGNVDVNSPAGSVRNGFYLSTDPVITAGDVFLTDNFNTNGVLQVGEQFDWGGPTLTIPAGTVPGTYYVGILVDDTGLVPEFDETNNYVSVAITVTGGAPDLIIESLTHSPVNPTDADLMEFGVTVKNQGTAAATGPFYVIVNTTKDGAPLETTTLPPVSSLAANESRTLCCWRSFRAAGDYSQTAIADFHTDPDLNNQVPESNEENNTRTDRYTVSATVGLLLRYSFEGDATNSGALPGYDGTATSVTYPDGKFGLGIKFDGTSGTSATFPGTATVFAIGSQWTISLWYKEDAPPKAQSGLWEFRGLQRGWESYHGVASSGGDLVITTCSNGGCFSFDNPATGAWHNVIYRYDAPSTAVGAPVSIYVDGTLAGSITNSTSIPLVGSGVMDIRIGNGFATVTGPSLFYVDEFRVYNQVFTVAQQCTDIIGGTWTGESCTLP